MRILLSFIVLLLCLNSTEAQKKYSYKKYFELPLVLKEASGMYIQSPDSLWLLNDSGDAAKLYLVNRNGKLLYEKNIPGIKNRDWESLANDGKGTIFICDSGNNRNSRKDLKIYILNQKTNQVSTLEFHYPDQKAFPPPLAEQNFDMEGVFYYKDSLYLFSKNRLKHGNYYSKIYRLPAEPGNHTAELIDSIYLKKRVVTAAAISPNGKTIALLSYNYRKLLGFFPYNTASVFLLTQFEGKPFSKAKLKRLRIPKFGLATQFEAIDFLDDQTLLIGAEKTKISPARVDILKIKR